VRFGTDDGDRAAAVLLSNPAGRGVSRHAPADDQVVEPGHVCLLDGDYSAW
jgi:hypothetical protein